MEKSSAANIEQVARFFIENVPHLGVSKRGVASVFRESTGKAVYLKQTPGAFKICFEALSDEAKGKFYETFPTLLLSLQRGIDDPSIVYHIEQTLNQRLGQPVQPRREGAPGEVYFNDVIATPLSELKLIYNIKNLQKSFLYEECSDITHTYDFEFINKRLRQVLGEGYDDWISTNSMDCVVEYRPTQPRFVEVPEKGYLVFNSWNDAEWRLGWQPSEGIDCPPEVKEFMDVFIPDPKERKCVYSWLRDATFERAEPILVLCGRPGTGKNILVEHIAGALVGKNNYRSASRGFYKSQFHAGVSNCRVFFLDEMYLTPDARETLKAYHNGTASIERKGVDVGDPEKIYASFALANNHDSKIKLEYTDRKFFVPQISEVPLEEALGKEKIDQLSSLLRDQDFLRRLGSYLFYNFKPQAAVRFPKNAFFKRLCINSYPHWFRRFLHIMQVSSEVNSKKFNKGHRTVDVFELKDSIKHYEAQFKEPLCEFEIDQFGNWTAKSKLYKDDSVSEVIL